MNALLDNGFVMPLLIFLAMILNVTISTIRIIFLAKNMKLLAPLLGFIEVNIWLLAITSVMKNLNNPANFIAFALGFSFGNFVGIFIENKIAMGMVMIRVITRMEADELVERLKSDGYTVTNVDAEGVTGRVKIIFTIIKRKNIHKIVNTIKEYNPQAFYTIENISFVSKNFVPMNPKDLYRRITPEG